MNNAANTTNKNISMTRREFDAATKENFGGRLASDERARYREARVLPHGGGPSFGRALAGYSHDRLEYRARMRPRGCAVLGLGSRWRNVATYGLAWGLPLLRNPALPSYDRYY